VRFHAEHGEVCPAGWKPGDRGMTADAEKALDYFGDTYAPGSAAGGGGGDDMAPSLRRVGSRREWDELREGGKPFVLDFYALSVCLCLSGSVGAAANGGGGFPVVPAPDAPPNKEKKKKKRKKETPLLLVSGNERPTPKPKTQTKNTNTNENSPWCGKCRMISPLLEELAAKHPDIVFAKLDTTAEPVEAIAAELGVKALPAFHFYGGDGSVARPPVMGYKRRPLEEAVESMAAAMGK